MWPVRIGLSAACLHILTTFVPLFAEVGPSLFLPLFTQTTANEAPSLRFLYPLPPLKTSSPCYSSAVQLLQLLLLRCCPGYDALSVSPKRLGSFSGVTCCGNRCERAGGWPVRCGCNSRRTWPSGIPTPLVGSSIQILRIHM